MTEATQPPAWFTQALEHRPTSHFATGPDGARIHYVCWNEDERDKPALLFIHGYRAHHHVWDFIAPFFVDRFRVVALDFSGMGESDHRDNYSNETFCGDIEDVVCTAALAPVTLVAHSFGGTRALRFCGDRPELVKQAVIVDSHVQFLDTDTSLEAARFGTRAEPYPDIASALARYRLLPEQPAEPYLFAHMAHHSLRQVEGGWTWKFDRDLPVGRSELDGEELLSRVQAPVAYMCGQHSAIVEEWRARRIVDTLPDGRGPVVVPDSYHHLMLDQPIAFIAALRALLA